MSPTLPDTLARLAELLPKGRFDLCPGTAGAFTVKRWETKNGFRSYVPEFVAYFGPAAKSDRGKISRDGMRALREALELECAERRWDWSLRAIHATDTRTDYFATVKGHEALADTPGHALALALIQALEEGA